MANKAKETKYKDEKWEITDRPIAVNFYTFESILEKYIKYLEKSKENFQSLIICIDEVSQLGDGLMNSKMVPLLVVGIKKKQENGFK